MHFWRHFKPFSKKPLYFPKEISIPVNRISGKGIITQTDWFTYTNKNGRHTNQLPILFSIFQNSKTSYDDLAWWDHMIPFPEQIFRQNLFTYHWYVAVTLSLLLMYYLFSFILSCPLWRYIIKCLLPKILWNCDKLWGRRVGPCRILL